MRGKIIYTSGKTFSSSNIINKSLEEFNEVQIKFIQNFKKKFAPNKIEEELHKLKN